MIGSLKKFFHQWTDAAASGLIGLMERVVSPRKIRLVERDDATFQVERGDAASIETVSLSDGVMGTTGALSGLEGGRLDVVLRPERFLRQPLELPAAAAGFLDGIVRAQIDRLSPWAPQDALFGWTEPEPLGGDRIRILVLAAPISGVKPLIEMLIPRRPAAISVHVMERGRSIKVHDYQAGGMHDAQRVARVARLALATALAGAALASAIWMILGNYFDGERTGIEAQIAQRRAAIRAGNVAAAQSPMLALERRKNELVPTVIVLEEISRVLPDTTFVTGMTIEGSALKVSGVTTDAPSLIPLIERSSRFSRATFFAPSTRGTAEMGEQFHIQVRIEPLGTMVKN